MTSSQRRKRIAFAAGGTGGHVYPALAVLRELLNQSAPPEILFFGRPAGLERNLVEALPVQYIGLPLTGIPRKLSWKLITSPLLACMAFLKILRTFFSRRPDLVVGFGSYVAGPVILAALCLGIPTIIHEQNSYPGLANRLLAPWVKVVLVSDSEAVHHLKRKDVRQVGIPLRPEVVHAPARPEALGLQPERKTMLIFGGSQGARKLCQVAVEALRILEPEMTGWQALLLTGKANYERVLSEQRPANLVVRDYLEDMGSAYATADLVIARAGAVSLAEMTANGLPSILIPLPIATGGHQLLNARSLETAGAAIVLEDALLEAESLSRIARELIQSPRRLASMAKAARSMGRPDATGMFIQEIMAVLESC